MMRQALAIRALVGTSSGGLFALVFYSAARTAEVVVSGKNTGAGPLAALHPALFARVLASLYAGALVGLAIAFWGPRDLAKMGRLLQLGVWIAALVVAAQTAFAP